MSDLDGIELVDWRELPPAQRRAWWEDLWDAAVALSARYRLALRRRWWEDALQLEALAAFYAWLRLYDTGAYTDPPGKLQLLWELERLRAVLRSGDTAFDPTTDKPLFERYLDALDHSGPMVEDESHADGAGLNHQAQLRDELLAVNQRLAELRQRHSLMQNEASESGPGRADRPAPTSGDLAQLRTAIDGLRCRETHLRRQLDIDDESTPAR